MEGDGEADRGTHGSGGCCMGKTTKVAKSNAGSEAELKALTHSILKKIKEKQLEVLLQAVESKGGARSPCLLLPSKVDAKVGQQSYSLPMLLYKVFRWPDLRHSSELKRLSCCESYGKINPELVCCNPHHMSRLCELGELDYYYHHYYYNNLIFTTTSRKEKKKSSEIVFNSLVVGPNFKSSTNSDTVSLCQRITKLLKG